MVSDTREFPASKTSLAFSFGTLRGRFMRPACILSDISIAYIDLGSAIYIKAISTYITRPNEYLSRWEPRSPTSELLEFSLTALISRLAQDSKFSLQRWRTRSTRWNRRSLKARRRSLSHLEWLWGKISPGYKRTLPSNEWEKNNFGLSA